MSGFSSVCRFRVRSFVYEIEQGISSVLFGERAKISCSEIKRRFGSSLVANSINAVMQDDYTVLTDGVAG